MRDERRDLRVGKRAGGEITLHQRLVGQGKFLKQLCLRLRKIDTALVQFHTDGSKQRIPVRCFHIHLVEEENDRHLIAPQQPPERDGVALNARRTADDEHSAIEHLQRPLHLGRKIHMSRRVKQRQRAAGQREDSLLGKDRDTSAAFLRVGVEKCIAVIDAAKRTDHARPIEHCLRQRRLARVHMGKQPHAKPFFRPFRSLCVHCRSPFVLIWENYSTKTKNRQEGGTDVQLLTAQNGPPGLIFRAGRCAYFIYLSAVKPYGSIAPRDSAT